MIERQSVQQQNPYKEREHTCLSLWITGWKGTRDTVFHFARILGRGQPGVNGGGVQLGGEETWGLGSERRNRGEIQGLNHRLRSRADTVFFLIYTSSPGDFVTSMASGINCNGWFLCLYTQPWKLGSSCLYPTASKNIHQLIHSLLCPRIKSSSQNLHNFPMFLNSTLAWTPSS